MVVICGFGSRDGWSASTEEDFAVEVNRYEHGSTCKLRCVNTIVTREGLSSEGMTAFAIGSGDAPALLENVSIQQQGPKYSGSECISARLGEIYGVDSSEIDR